MAKSQLLLSSNISVEMGNNLSTKFGIPRALELGLYLGMPLLHKRVRQGTYHFLVEKLRKTLSNWKGRTRRSGLSLFKRIFFYDC